MNAIKTYYLDVFAKHYFDLVGRATRTQFWIFVLINVIVMWILGMILGHGLIYKVIDLLILIPCIAIAVRRLHDAGFSGWWILIGLIPVVGWIALIVLYCLPTKK